MNKVFKPIYKMTWEEFERTLPETLTNEEENEIFDEIFKIEAPKYSERYYELTGVKYEIEELESMSAEITSYGGEEWAEKCYELEKEVCHIRPIMHEWE